jgi:hypothetical protein
LRNRQSADIPSGISEEVMFGHHTSNVYVPFAHGLMLDNFLKLARKLFAIQQAATMRLSEICCEGKPP